MTMNRRYQLSTAFRTPSCTLKELTHIETVSDNHYREVRQRKKDGTPRICYDAKPPLKAMQARIQCLILKMVKYPSYLMGGLADKVNPRDYVRNAKVHVGARTMVNEDIAKFFPSTSAALVFDIWRRFFHFPAEVAQALTRLTTRQGELPQGAKTSSYIANLVFWETEPDVVAALRSMGFEYTRYVDDMTISSKDDKSAEELGTAISHLASMVKRYGLRFKRSKQRLVRAGQRMEVTGLVVANHSAGLRRGKRSSIRALVHQCEIRTRLAPESEELQIMRRRAASQVGQYSRLHPAQGRALKRRLDAIKE